MDTLFTSEFFSNNRKRLREHLADTVPIVVTANGLLQRNNDSTFPFRQDSNFWYLTGIDEPDILLVMHGSEEYLAFPVRETSRISFDGSINIQELSRRSGIKNILEANEGWERLDKIMKRSKRIATLQAPPSYVEQHGIYTNPARTRLQTILKERYSEVEIVDMRHYLVNMRSIKQKPELTAIQKAIDVTVNAFSALIATSINFKNENEIEGYITSCFRTGAAQHAYQPIVAAGKNACTLHYIRNNDSLTAKNLLLIDAGAEIENYAADITRTFAIGSITDRQEQVITAVKEIKAYAESILNPGVLLKDYEKNVEECMGEKLIQLGLIKKPEKSEIRRYYPHSTSHHLGLDVHDVADYNAQLQKGMVLTIEPGIYIPEEGIGVRIEDDVLITDNGIKNLSKKLPTTF